VLNDNISNDGRFLMTLLTLYQNTRAGHDVMEHQPLAAMRETRDFLLAHTKMTKSERLELYTGMAEVIWPHPAGEEVPEGFPRFPELMLNQLKESHEMGEDDVADEENMPEEPKCNCIEEYNKDSAAWPKWLEIQHITETALFLHCPVCNIDRKYTRS